MSDDHFDRLARLLDLEARAVDRALADAKRRGRGAEVELSGSGLVGLFVVDEHAGLGGRRILIMTKAGRRPLPWSRLDAGTPVLLSSDEEAVRGVVSMRDEVSLAVAVDDLAVDVSGEAPWRVDAVHDEASIARQKKALLRAKNAKRDRLAELRAVLLGERPPLEPGSDRAEVERFFGDVDASQAEAVRLAHRSADVTLIHGPPGTGKTTALVEVILQAAAKKERVLACAPSNMGADNLLDRLVQANLRVVRLGHPARVLPHLHAHSLDVQVENHEGVRLARKLVEEAFALRRKAGKYTRAKPEPGARERMREEARGLIRDARRLEAQAVERILDGAEVVVSTLSLDPEVLGDRTFDLVVIDEACQSTEPASWVAVARAGRLVLAGDHLQLPPTVVSEEAAAEGLGRSLFERLIDLYGGTISRRLDIQYRMHRDIMTFPSRELYHGTLAAHASVAGHRLADLEGVLDVPATRAPFALIDTAGAGYDEELEPDGFSKRNTKEAELAVEKVAELRQAGVGSEAIAVITPYAAQVRLIRALFEARGIEGVEVDSVDGFQGREKEAVVISLVRANAEQEIGFLGDIRRMNVAITRARRSLMLIGDSATLSGSGFYRRLFDYAEEISAYRTVWEEAAGSS